MPSVYGEMAPTIGSCALQDPPVVLVTGYEPFADYSTNSSKQVVKYLSKMGIEGLDIRTEILPVEYAAVKKRSQELIEKLQPLLTIHCGMNCEARAILIEQEARNSGYYIADELDQLPERNCCMNPAAPECLSTGIDLEALVAKVSKISPLPVRISRNAGNYVCEFLYYCSLSRCRRTLFVHLPYISRKFTRHSLFGVLKEIIIHAVRQCKRHGDDYN